MDGDDNIDIVLYYPPQQLAYVAYGPSFTNFQPFFAIGDTSYQPTRIADYNRDGRFDVVVRNTPTGYAFAWYFADRTFLGGAGLFGADMVWQQTPALEPYQKAAQVGPVGTAVSKPIPPGLVAPRPVHFPANALAPLLRRSPLGTRPVPSTTGPVAPGPPTPPGGKSLMKSLGSNSFAIYEIHSDHLNTPRMITRPSDRKPVWKWDNVDPFGANAPDENPSGVGAFTFNLRLPGQVYDAETAKHYNYFRDYDPALGRYIQSDPVGVGSDLNTYAYVGGHPLSSLDDFGLAECTNLTCFPGFKNRRLISATTSKPSPWALENIHIEPINEPPYPPTRFAGRLPWGVLGGNELGSCFFARYRDVDEVYGIFRQFACLQVCTGDCGAPYSRWNIQERQEDTEQKHRREREQFVKNFSAKIGALACRKFLEEMR